MQNFFSLPSLLFFFVWSSIHLSSFFLFSLSVSLIWLLLWFCIVSNRSSISLLHYHQFNSFVHNIIIYYIILHYTVIIGTLIILLYDISSFISLLLAPPWRFGHCQSLFQLLFFAVVVCHMQRNAFTARQYIPCYYCYYH